MKKKKILTRQILIKKATGEHAREGRFLCQVTVTSSLFSLSSLHLGRDVIMQPPTNFLPELRTSKTTF